MLDYKQIYESDHNSQYYNLNSLKNIFLTTDIDWAPDFATEDVLSLVNEYNFKITAYATHRSDLLLSRLPYVEVGLHPDNTRPHPEFLFSKKLTDLKEIYPDSVGLRCHRNFFGNNISDLAKKCGLKYDASTLLWLQPFCSSFWDYNNLLRASYYWEDGIHCDKGLDFRLETIKLDNPGLKIFNVHPILIYLNAPNDNYRRTVTSKYTDLTQAKYSDLKSQIYQGYGIRSFYVDMLKHFKSLDVQSHFMRELAESNSV